MKHAARAVVASLLLLAVACGGSQQAEAPDSDTGAQDATGAEEGVDANGVVVRKDGEAVDDYIDRLYAAAQEEGQVQYYQPADEEEVQAVVDKWNEVFPEVELVPVSASSGGIVERLLVEGRSGRGQADVFSGSAGDQAVVAAEDLLVEYRPANEEFVDPQFVFEGEPYIALAYLSRHVAYNTDKVQAGDLPSDWEGFLDPKWKGQLALDQDSFEWYAGVTDGLGEQGDDFMTRLAEQDIRLVDGTTLRTELLAAGEFGVMLDGYGHSLKEFIDEGAPIEVMTPQPGPIPVILDMFAVMKDAPHPNGARLAAEFFLSEEGQQIFYDEDKPGVRVEGYEHPYADYVEGAELNILGPQTVDFGEASQKYRDIFVRG
jgi:iron(III) transport system substrate-binding protein